MKTFATAAVTALITLASVPAQADMTRTVTGAYGRTATTSASSGCYVDANGAKQCGRTTSTTGNNGNTYSRDRSVTCMNGTCSGTKSVTGAAGQTRGRTVTVSR